ncbi:unnamed protein product [Danaus chrysippus]|uniref:Proteasome subunit beta n=1 Tax=Danaus chrysippus TaxID=151541 RepID=A0A8J2R636_9NEOP|nr:unnamed protein product [Danaus chrysippus]
MSNTSLLFQCLLGIRCNDFTMIAADQTNTQGVLIMKDDDDRLLELADKIVLGVNGTTGDMVQFTQFIAKNLRLYEMRNKYGLDSRAVVHFTRKIMADGLRDGNPCLLNVLMAGYDDELGSQLYSMDFLASCVSVPFAVHGLGGFLSLSIIDNYYKPTLTEIEAYDVIKMCVSEIQSRLFLNLSNFGVKSVTKWGVKTLPTINPSTFTSK